MAKRDPRLRAFVKVDKFGQVVPSTLILRRKPPENGTSHYWIEIEANECCSFPLSTFSYSLNGGTGLFTLAVGGNNIVTATNTEAGDFNVAVGQSVTTTVSGSEGLNRTLLIVDDTTGVILSNQVGTGTLTFTYTSNGDVYTVIATQNLTTTTTTTTTTTSTSTTTTTSTTHTTTTTTTTSTTTTTTTIAAGNLRVVNNHASPSGVTITDVGPGTSYTGGTFPVAAASTTNMTLVNSTNIDTTVTIAATGLVGSATLTLFKNGALVETLGVITTPGTYTFGAVSFTTADNLEVVLT